MALLFWGVVNGLCLAIFNYTKLFEVLIIVSDYGVGLFGKTEGLTPVFFMELSPDGKGLLKGSGAERNCPLMERQRNPVQRVRIIGQL